MEDDGDCEASLAGSEPGLEPGSEPGERFSQLLGFGEMDGEGPCEVRNPLLAGDLWLRARTSLSGRRASLLVLAPAKRSGTQPVRADVWLDSPR